VKKTPKIGMNLSKRSRPHLVIKARQQILNIRLKHSSQARSTLPINQYKGQQDIRKKLNPKIQRTSQSIFDYSSICLTRNSKSYQKEENKIMKST